MQRKEVNSKTIYNILSILQKRFKYYNNVIISCCFNKSKILSYGISKPDNHLHSIKNNKIGAVLTEIMFDDVYDKYFSFSEIEKYLTKENYRMVAIELSNNNLFSGLTFAADVLYLNRKHHVI